MGDPLIPLVIPVPWVCKFGERSVGFYFSPFVAGKWEEESEEKA